jgi:hypothetical protein
MCTADLVLTLPESNPATGMRQHKRPNPKPMGISTGDATQRDKISLLVGVGNTKQVCPLASASKW